MPRKKKVTLSMKMIRDFTLTLEPISGGITLFYAFINGVRILGDDGTRKRTWSGKIPDAQIFIKVRVVGINNAIFKIGIDLPGTADDQSLTLQLKGGYYETDFTL